MKKILPYIIVGFFILPFFFGGCANTSRGPSGGPKDSLPPVLINQTPAENTLNFKGNQVSFSFDEYVKFKDQQKQFIISPPTERRPNLKIRGKRAIVDFQSPLQDSTTYFIDFGTSVVDINEGNPYQNLSVVFSTGPTIDSMIYIGRLVDAFSLEPVEGSFAFLYRENTDSIPYLSIPNAVARTDMDGIFIIKGLKPVDYKLVFVDDRNANYKYDPGAEKIGFSDSLIQTIHLTDSDTLTYESLPIFKLFEENVRKQFLSSYKQNEKRQFELIFNHINPEIINFEVEGLTADEFIIERNRWNDTIKYWIKATSIPDSLKATITYLGTDSLSQLSPIELQFRIEPPRTETDNKNNKTNEEEDFEEIITPTFVTNSRTVVEQGIRLKFPSPLVKYDTTLLTLYKYSDDEEQKMPVTFTWLQDTLLIREYIINTDWDIASKYELEVLPYAFTDVYGFSNDSITNKFETANPDRYSSITLNLTNNDSPYIIQLVKGNNIVAQKYADGQPNVTFAYLDAGQYRIRIIEDKNGNKFWDSGNYLQRLQPERVAFVKFADDSRELDLRANWDIEQPVDLNLIFN